MDRPCQNCQQYFDIREHNGKCPKCNFDNFNQSTCTENVSIKTKKINMKNTFKHGQQVQHSRYGVGTFELNEANEFRVVYDIIATDWRVIGNLHYSQLHPIEDLPEVGEYAYFWA